jgi:hypothetical protein
MSELVAYVGKKIKKIEFSDDSFIKINSKKIQFNLLSLDPKTYLVGLDNKLFEATAQKIDDERYSIKLIS